MDEERAYVVQTGDGLRGVVRRGEPEGRAPDELFSGRGPLVELELVDWTHPSLPRWLLALPDLRVLVVNYNGRQPLHDTQNLPPALETLVFRGSQTTTLPRPRDAACRVRSLQLSGVGLAVLPESVASYRELEELTVNAPLLHTLARGVGSLTRLRRLVVTSQRLSVLPAELGRLSDTVDLSFDCPQLADSFAALLTRGVPALLTYLRSLEQDAQEQYEAKVIFIGEGNVGKSCLVSALCGGDFVEQRPTTHGIEVSTLGLPHPTALIGGTEIRLNLWDFGGQEAYRIGHQFFYSRRSLYVLVWRPREGREENAVEDWIRRVRLRVGNEARILIVATHRDAEGHHPELDYPHLREKYGAVLVGDFFVDNRTGSGIDALRDAIAAEAAKLPQMGELISGVWLAVREDVLDRAAERPYLSRSEYLEICHRRGLDQDAAITLATLLHDLGYVVHFEQEHGLREVMVLQPEWLTKAIDLVLRDEITRSAGGVLDYGRLAKIWGSGGERGYPADLHPYFLRLMELFDFSYRMEERSEALVGQLVPHVRPELPWLPSRAVPSNEQEAALICTFSEPPPGLMAWLTVRNHRYWTGLHWRRGVYLACEDYGATALFELTSENELRLTVRGPSPYMFFALLRDSVQHLVKQRWNGLEHSFLVPCRSRGTGGSQCRGRFAVSSLETFKARGRSTIDCHTCAESQDIVSLLTGFATVQGTQRQLRELSRKIDDLDRSTRVRAADVLEGQRELRQELRRGMAETALHLRAVKKMLEHEQQDCPSLFSLARRRRRSPLAHHYRMTLWCEEINRNHPWPEAAYDLSFPKPVMREVLPYLRMIVPLLQLAVPLAGRIAEEAFAEGDQRVAEQLLASSRELLDGEGLDADAGAVDDGTNGGDESRRGFRTFRYLLLETDRLREFGGMDSRRNSSGDVLWLCPEHLQRYDPGLPLLP